MSATSDCHVCKAPTQPGRTLCGLCTGELLDAIHDAPDLAAALDVAYLRQQRFSVAAYGLGNPDESPLPYREHASKLRRRLASILLDIALDGVHVAVLRAPRNSGARTTTQAVVDAIDEDRIPHHHRAADWHGALTRLREQILAAVDMPPDLVYLGGCTWHTADGKDCYHDLYAEWGAETCTCPSCGHIHDVARLRDELIVSVRDQLSDATTIARGLHGFGLDIAPARIHQWRSRKLIHPKATSRTGQPLYRVGDIIDRALADATRRANDAE